MAQENEKQKKKNDKKIKYIFIAIITLAVVAVGLTIYMLNSKGENDDKELAYTDLIREITEGSIEKIEMTVGSTSIKVKVKDVEEEIGRAHV